VIKTQNCQMK